MPAELLFRTAAHADVPSIHVLVERAYRGESAHAGWTHEADLLGGQRTDPEALAQMIADPAQRLLLAFDGAQLVASVALADRGGGLAYLGMFAVEPTLQSAGIGRQVLAEAEALVREVFSTGRLEMRVFRQRTELLAWYVRRGYALTGETQPFPFGDLRLGIPKTDDLVFLVLAKRLP